MVLLDLKCNYETEPKGIEGTPVFSWKYTSEQKSTLQTAYQLWIYDTTKLVYDSGKIQGKENVCVEATGFQVLPDSCYEWKVHIWDNHGEETEAGSYFEGAISQWKAKWIEPENGGIGYEPPISVVTAAILGKKPKGKPEERMMPVTMIRKVFEAKDQIKKARIYATAHGIYQLLLNGMAMDERRFAPEYSSYQKCLFYQIYDVTDKLQAGKNAIGVLLADGWWGGRCGMGGECQLYGSTRGFLMQLELEYTSGEKEIIISDNSFHWSDQGHIRYSDLFIGEMQDMRFYEKSKSFSCAVYAEDKEWSPVAQKDYGYQELTPQIAGKVVPFQEFKPTLVKNPKNEIVLDFGQNFAGIVRAKIQAPKGTVVTLEHAEVLDKKGNYFNNILGVNKNQCDVFICSDAREDIFEPQFTFHGFRYVRVTGLSSVNPEDFTGIALTTEMKNLAEFSCSNSKLNQLYQNSRWSGWANMISIPTDCPQREKAGWTGDIQIFSPTAAYHQDMDPFLRRWMKSVAAEQFLDGQIPPIVPYTRSYQKIMQGVFHGENSCGWSDSCIIVPYVMYQMYQDKRILAEYYLVMKNWFAYIKNEAETKVSKTFEKKKHRTAREIENQKYLWNTGFHFGDWLVPSYQGKDTTKLKKVEPLFAAMYYAYDAKLMAEVAEILGEKEEAEQYQKLFQRIRQAFMETYVSDDGSIILNTQGAYVCALWFDLIPEELIQKAGSHLEELIKKNGNCLDTGFLATPLLLDVLMKIGKKDLAYQLLYQEQCPSWFYEIDRGATTIWECWDGIKPNGKVGNMSYNHYAFGCVSDFMNRMIIGIRKEAVGYERILIKPEPDETLTWAKGSYECIYGRITCSWKKEADRFLLEAEIPCGTTATIVLPNQEQHVVGSGSYQYEIKL